MMRKKFKKTINLTTLDKIWKQYCEYGVVRPLIKYGRAEIDPHTRLEIVGKRIVDDKRIYGLFMNGKNLNKNGKMKFTTT